MVQKDCSFLPEDGMQDDPGIVQPHQFTQSQESFRIPKSGDPRIRCEIER